MKSWLGVIGRACLEFAIILILLSFAVGASASAAVLSGGLQSIYKNAAEAAFRLTPLAAVLTLFLAFFSFELRIKSRAAGWLGLFFLGAMLLSFGIGLRRAPAFRGIAAVPRTTASALRLLPVGAVVQQRRVALYIGSYEGREAADVVAVDFGSDYPRLAYAPRASFDPSSGDVDVQGRSYKAALPAERPVNLVPEASLFSGSWIWDRLASMDSSPLYFVFAVAGGFLLLAIGFRFLCRLTGWPLANVFLAAAGLAGLVVMDASLSGSAPLGMIESLSRRIGVSLPDPLLLACIEGALGLALGAIDIAAAPKSRRHRGE
jgi:hypothetical protein